MFCESEMRDAFILFQDFFSSWLASRKIKLLFAFSNFTTFVKFCCKEFGKPRPLVSPQNAAVCRLLHKAKSGDLERDTLAFFSDAETWERVPSNPFRDINRSQGKLL